MQPKIFENSLINWYKHNARNLPWRATTSPYRIWLSEIILQQTKVDQGLPYYERFIERYPKIQCLAEAKEEEVLRLWQGLGYYSRARNLHKCAQLIVNKYNSTFPDNYHDLQQLPGIGKYTAAAIASFAFEQAVPAIDGNAYRVLSRVFGIEQDIAASKAHSVYFKFAEPLMHKNRASIFNQAIMEFGAMYCKPKNPDCEVCVMADICIAKENKLQGTLPIKLKKQSVRKRYLNYFIFRKGNKLALKKRTGEGIWKNLYDFYLFEKEFDEQLIEEHLYSLATKTDAKFVLEKISKSYKHVLSHQHLFTHFITINIEEESETSDLWNVEGLEFYTVEEIQNLPKPKLISSYLSQEFNID